MSTETKVGARAECADGCEGMNPGCPEHMDCSWCGGEGEVHCDDGFDCWQPDCSCGMHRCPACNGSGRAKDQTLW